MITRDIYVLECPACGWKAYRDKHLGYRVCSKCGRDGQPIVTAMELEVKPNPHLQGDFERAKQVAKGLLDGEALEEMMERLNKCKDQSTEAVDRRNLHIISGIMGGFLSATATFKWCVKGHLSVRIEETY